LAAFFVSGDVPTMFGTRGSTRHVKCARLDAFYMSGGERRLPNTNYMPILAWFLCSAEVGCVRATAVGRDAERNAERSAVLAGDPKRKG